MSDPWGTDASNGWGADDGWGSSQAQTPKRGCFKCGEEGHNKANCPQGDGDRKRGCFNCGEEGHNKADCPQPLKQSSRACFRCGEEGHSKADCPNPAIEKPRTCHKCGEEGHNKADCPQGGGGGEDAKPRGCFKCGKEGHSRADCTEPDICRNCGGEGHLAKDCSEEAKTRMVKDKEGKDVEIYVPGEVAEEQLFDQGIHSGINFDNFDKIPISVSGENPPAGVSTFEATGLRQILLQNVARSGYVKPTPIQKVAIPMAMMKRDLMSCAQTGSGKTAAFLLPILHDLLASGVNPEYAPCQAPQALIIAPTRELAIQIKDEARKFAAGSCIKSVVAYGGTSTAFQTVTLQRGCNILIGTPGRIKDFLNRGKITFDQIRFLVLDEADRLLDMGFSEAIREIISGGNMPDKGKRVTMMFSATFPSDVQQLAADFLQDYLFVKIGIVGAANTDVSQIIHEVTKFDKREKLVEILREVGSSRTMVFVETKRNCDFIAAHLCTEGFPATSIHGDRLQREREIALADFKSGRMNIIVATNVAARGLDIRGVEHVINYDLPESIDEYVHRIGRTGRVGNTGKATSFFDPSDDKNVKIASGLVKILADAQLEVPDFLRGFSGMGGGGNGVHFGGSDIRGGPVTNMVEEEW